MQEFVFNCIGWFFIATIVCGVGQIAFALIYFLFAAFFGKHHES